MKQALLFTLLLLLALYPTQAQQQVAIYYNQNWQVTKKENATYTRLATISDSLIRAGHLFSMPFERSVADYYSSGQLLARGSYINGQKQAAWLFYYPNGQLQSQGIYIANEPAGAWQFWRENGQQLQEVIYDGQAMKLKSYWDESGTQTIIRGTGTYIVPLPGGTPDSHMQLKGAYVNGERQGTWQYAPLAGGVMGKPVIEQLYKNGTLAKGYIYQQGKKTAYTTGDRFKLEVGFPYLKTVESWAVDTSAFEPGFPVLAYMLKHDVQEVHEKGEAQQLVSYYKVVLPAASGTDTLKLAKQPASDTMPKFPGGEEAMFRFLGKTIRYPAAAQRAGQQGIVLLSFMVQPDGTIIDIKVVNSQGSALDNESIRVVKLMPLWIPALSNGVPVAASFVLPVRYTIAQSPAPPFNQMSRPGF